MQSRSVVSGAQNPPFVRLPLSSPREPEILDGLWQLVD